MTECPTCKGGLPFPRLKEMMMALPMAQRRKLGAALLSSSRRKDQRVGGRPRLDVPRCPCGLFTVTTATTRRHVCTGSTADTATLETVTHVE